METFVVHVIGGIEDMLRCCVLTQRVLDGIREGICEYAKAHIDGRALPSLKLSVDRGMVERENMVKALKSC